MELKEESRRYENNWDKKSRWEETKMMRLGEKNWEEKNRFSEMRWGEAKKWREKKRLNYEMWRKRWEIKLEEIAYDELEG